MLQHHGRLANCGFTMIEALIAATVLAVGMLGNAAMLLHSLQANRLALQRTQAVALAADIADRMRAVRVAAASFTLAAGRTLAAPATSCDAANPCSPEEIAAIELYSWQQSVMRTLPEAQTSITAEPADTSAATLYTITIAWAQTGDGTLASITLTVQA